MSTPQNDSIGRHPHANSFFYRFFNDRIDDPGILELIDEMLYSYVSVELMRLKTNARNADRNTFMIKLNDRLRKNFPLLCKQTEEAIANR